jgi:membrane associated rhomboid family serine protease
MSGRSPDPAAWRNLSFEAKPVDRWRVMVLDDRKVRYAELQELADSWRILSKKLVSAPNTQFFVHPLRAPKLGQILYDKWKRQNVLVLGILLFAGFVLLWKGGDGSGHKNMVAAFLMAFFSLSNILASPSPNALAERSEFFLAVIDKARAHLWFVILIAALSFFLSGFPSKNFEDVALSYGAMIDKVVSGEVWRLLTGPLVHSGLTHWIVNNMLLLTLFPMVAFYSMRSALLLFFGGVLLGQVYYIALGLLGFHSHDLLVGISGGNYSLMAYLAADALIWKKKYPTGFFLLVLALILMNLVGSELLNPRASLIAHGSGILLGVVPVFLKGFVRKTEVK